MFTFSVALLERREATLNQVTSIKMIPILTVVT